MKERPILFTGADVRAILDGSKVQTRRPIKTSPELDDDEWSALAFVGTPGWNVSPSLAKKAQRRVTSQRALDPGNVWAECLCREIDPSDTPCLTCEGRYKAAPWQVGDRLWVRETWQALRFSKDFETGYVDDIYFAEIIPKHNDDAPYANPWEVAYAADPCWESHREDRGFPWRPSIHMPRWASRITLLVTAIRVERVQDITNDDALREGIRELPLQRGEPGAWWTGDVGKGAALHARTPRGAFARLWERIHGAGAWDRNDWVWVVEFQRVDG